MKNQICAPIWWAASAASLVRAATDAATVNATKKATVRRPQVAGGRELAADPLPRGSERRAAADEQHEEDAPRGDLGHDVGDGRAADPHVEPEHEHRRQEDRRDVGDADDVERRPRVLKAAHPSLRGRGHEHERGAERRDADPLQPLRGGGGRAARHRVQGRLRDELDRHHEDRPQPEREPGRLNPGVEREAVLARAVEARGPRRRPVLEEGAEPEDLGEQEARRARGRPAAPCRGGR